MKDDDKEPDVDEERSRETEEKPQRIRRYAALAAEAWRADVRPRLRLAVAAICSCATAPFRWLYGRVRAEPDTWNALGTLVTGFATIATVFLTTGVIVSALLQWDAARDSIEESRRAFRIERQPWVSVKGISKVGEFTSTEKGKPTPSPADTGRIVVEFTNTGSTPALKLSGALMFRICPRGIMPDFGYDPGDEGGPASVGVLAPGQKLTSDIPARSVFEGIFTAEKANAAHWVVVYGYRRYADRFGSRYCSTFCAVGQPIYGETKFKACEGYSDIYEEDSDNPCPPATRASTPTVTPWAQPPDAWTHTPKATPTPAP